MTPPLTGAGLRNAGAGPKQPLAQPGAGGLPKPPLAQPGAGGFPKPPLAEPGAQHHHRRHRRGVVHRDEAPDHTRIDFITHGYRVDDNLWTAAYGLFTLHNETLNVWTHLLGLVWFTVELPWVLDRVSSQGGGFADAVCFFLFIACAQFQMFASTAYHLLRCVSPMWDDFLLRVDIVGIVVMVMGSFAVGLHTGFRCQPAYLYTYLAIEAAPLLTACVLLLRKSLQSPFMCRVRNALLVGGVAFGVVPVTHVLFECDLECAPLVVPAAASMFGLYFAGFTFYALQIPERWLPGWFDLLLSSHQIWHVFVWLAGAAWLHGMVAYHGWAVEHLVCPTPQ